MEYQSMEINDYAPDKRNVLEYRSMKPGRELDAEIAKLLGWTNVKLDCWAFYGKGWYGTHPNLERTVIPHYSTEIKEAWGAWEWVEENKPEWELNYALSKNADDIPALLGYEKLDGQWYCEELLTGETYPHLICLAALMVSQWKLCR
jgi:hypothetical protein